MAVKNNGKNGLVLENVSKHYEDNVVLSNVNLHIRKGEFVCIIGSSGCGKSTLLNVMAGIETPSSGKVYINGIERTKSNNSQLQKLTGVVFQQDRLMEWRTVKNNVRFPLEIFHLAAKMKQKNAGIPGVLIGAAQRYTRPYPVRPRNCCAAVNIILLRAWFILINCRFNENGLCACDKKIP